MLAPIGSYEGDFYSIDIHDIFSHHIDIVPLENLEHCTVDIAI